MVRNRGPTHPMLTFRDFTPRLGSTLTPRKPLVTIKGGDFPRPREKPMACSQTRPTPLSPGGPRAPRTWLGLAAVLVLGGCQEADDIRQYKAPRVEYPESRMLAAICSQKDYMWFFKVQGSPKAIGDQVETFEKFLHSVEFTGRKEEPVTWEVPDGWNHQPGPGSRYATFTFGTRQEPLELTVTPLGGTLLDNINRWRQQFLLLDPVTEKELDSITRKIEGKNSTFTVVDMKGFAPIGKKTIVVPPPQRPPVPPAKRDLPLKYQVPDGWREMADLPEFAVAAFQVGQGQESALISVTPAGGSLLFNVNRWRGQVKLPPVKEGDLPNLVGKIPCAGVDSAYVDLQGPQRRILGVVHVQDNATWFFKVIGPDRIVGQQKPAFEAFVRSVTFP